ncbi:ubiquitin-like-specific protease 1D isoform X1 [Senna tora]|uniref:Ubiquitin-like-specific protease 1D isoform X1 n=1 Tax=Senna tora TaxID=362788 RepID=A0A834W9Y1_9FABA|nr:ubiquitin-like-specific protease 1D isoform X1 [Senna tora]
MDANKKLPLQLDWNQLLPSRADDEPPPMLIVKPPSDSLSHPRKPSRFGSDHPAFPADDLGRFNDRELSDMLKRKKATLDTTSRRLPDKGEKLRDVIKRYEDELARREMQHLDKEVDDSEKPRPDTSSSTVGEAQPIVLDDEDGLSVLQETDQEDKLDECLKEAKIYYPSSQHWSLAIICIPDKEDESGPIILHLDSLGLHCSRSVFDNIRRYLIEEWKHLAQESMFSDISIAYGIWENLDSKIEDTSITVPQQKNDYDCGLFVLYFIKRFIEEAPKRLKKKDLAMFGKQWFKPEEASNLRAKIRNLLKEEFRNSCNQNSSN